MEQNRKTAHSCTRSTLVSGLAAAFLSVAAAGPAYAAIPSTIWQNNEAQPAAISPTGTGGNPDVLTSANGRGGGPYAAAPQGRGGNPNFIASANSQGGNPDLTASPNSRGGNPDLTPNGHGGNPDLSVSSA